MQKKTTQTHNTTKHNKKRLKHNTNNTIQQHTTQKNTILKATQY